MTKEQAEYLYGSIEAYYGISVIGSIFYGVLGFVFQIYIYGFDNILEKVGCSCVTAVTIFLLATFDVTFDILKNDKKRKQ